MIRSCGPRNNTSALADEGYRGLGVPHAVTLVPGDGVGPEVVAATVRVLEACVAIEWDVQDAGSRSLGRGGRALPEAVVESMRRTGVGLKGPLQTSRNIPGGSPNVALRKTLGLHTTIRPCRARGPIGADREVDLVVVKMNQEDLYARIGLAPPEAAAELSDIVRAASGLELGEDAAVSLRPISRSAARRTIETAFAYARENGRRRVTALHKAVLIPETDGLFLEVAREVGEEYPDIEQDDALIDTACERLISRPSAYDVLVMPRMYGDIVSGIAAALVGGPGVAPGVNVGEGCAVFEAMHGSAPRLAGTGRANPLALILSGALLLRHVGEARAADRLEAAVSDVTAGPTLTYDLDPAGAAAGTDEVADAVIAALHATDPTARESDNETAEDRTS